MERGGGRESVAVDAEASTDTVSQRRVAMEVAGLAVWGGAQRRTKLTDEQVPLPLSALTSAMPLEQGTIGLFCSVPERVEQAEHVFMIFCTSTDTHAFPLNPKT